MERDPVCGMTVNSDNATAKTEHSGKTYYFCSQGCLQKFQREPGKYLSTAVSPPGITPPATAKPVTTSLPILAGRPKEKDPVCGMKVDPEKAAGKVEHKGQNYCFCSLGCADRFRKEPEKYLAMPGTAGMEDMSPQKPPAPATSKNVRYMCPMHPEIVQIGPGSCPICGMALEPMDIIAEEQPDEEYESMRKRFWVSAALSLPWLSQTK